MTDKAPTVFEDDITTGNSPVTVTLADTQGHPIGGFIVVNTGPARFTVQESIDEDAFGDPITIEPRDAYKINSRTEQADSPFLDRILISRITADSSFKVIGSPGEVDFKPNPVIKYTEPDTPLAITLNTTTYTTLFAANEDRNGYKVSNLNNNTILIREKAFGDDLDRGFALFGRMIYESKTSPVPTGAILAKALTGTPSVLATEE